MGNMAEVVELLPRKCEALISNHSITKNKKVNKITKQEKLLTINLKKRVKRRNEGTRERLRRR
jgi:hypothetical protein